MNEAQLTYFQQLLDTPSPSGFEGAVQQLVYRRMTEYCTEVATDVHGNVLGTLAGESNLRVLLTGHSDEIGLMVKHVTDEGQLCFAAIGGVDPLVLPGQRVRLLGPHGDVHGVIGRIPIHLQDAEERDKGKIKIHELWIDIGARDRDEAMHKAPVGTPGVWGESFRRLENGLVTARDFDDKVGVFVVCEAMRRLAECGAPPPHTVIGVASIQEECGVWGAGPVAEAVNPHAAIAIDVTHATDYPGVDKRRFGDVRLGKGPVLYRGVKSSKALQRAIEAAATRLSIPLQNRAEEGRFHTDADPIASRRLGIPVANLSVPLRYMHTSSEVIALDDVDAAVDLLVETLLFLPHDTRFSAFQFS